MFAPTKMTQKLRAMMCNYAVTAPLQKEKQASTALSASACKILTFLQDEDIHRRLIVVV